MSDNSNSHVPTSADATCTGTVAWHCRYESKRQWIHSVVRARISSIDIKPDPLTKVTLLLLLGSVRLQSGLLQYSVVKHKSKIHSRNDLRIYKGLQDAKLWVHVSLLHYDTDADPAVPLRSAAFLVPLQPMEKK